MNEKWWGNIKAIGWDLDGTLYPPDAIPRQVVRNRQILEIAKANRWSESEAEGKFAETVGEMGSTTKALTALGVDGPGFFRGLWDSLPLEQYIRPDENLVRMFEELSDYRHFMISNSNTQAQIERKLGILGLNPVVFESVISTDELGVVKPDLLPFKVALEKLQLPPAEVLYVGDRVETDVVGGKNAGMKTCLVGGERNNEADMWIETVYELGTTLKNAKQKL